MAEEKENNKKKTKVKITSEQSKKIVKKLEQMWLPGMEPPKESLVSQAVKKAKSVEKPAPKVRTPKL